MRTDFLPLNCPVYSHYCNLISEGLSKTSELRQTREGKLYDQADNVRKYALRVANPQVASRPARVVIMTGHVPLVAPNYYPASVCMIIEFTRSCV
jgi:hypothetical protein